MSIALISRSHTASVRSSIMWSINASRKAMQAIRSMDSKTYLWLLGSRVELRSPYRLTTNERVKDSVPMWS